MQANRHLLDVETTIERAERAARLMAANGYRAVRSHADTTTDARPAQHRGARRGPSSGRRRHRHRDRRAVRLAGRPAREGADQRALLVDAMAAGADLVGGCPHLESESARRRPPTSCCRPRPITASASTCTPTRRSTRTCSGSSTWPTRCSPGSRTLSPPATASASGCSRAHASSEIAELVAAAGISVVALPHTNLFLQGRGHAVRCPGPDRRRSAARRRRQRRRRCRQPPGPVQSGRPGLPVRDRRPDDHDRPSAPPRRLAHGVDASRGSARAGAATDRRGCAGRPGGRAGTARSVRRSPSVPPNACAGSYGVQRGTESGNARVNRTSGGPSGATT